MRALRPLAPSARHIDRAAVFQGAARRPVAGSTSSCLPRLLLWVSRALPLPRGGCCWEPPGETACCWTQQQHFVATDYAVVEEEAPHVREFEGCVMIERACTHWVAQGLQGSHKQRARDTMEARERQAFLSRDPHTDAHIIARQLIFD